MIQRHSTGLTQIISALLMSGVSPIHTQAQATDPAMEGGRASQPELVEPDIYRALAGYKLEFISSNESRAINYVEYFNSDGTWLAEVPGRVTLNHRGQWRVMENSVCVIFNDTRKVTCRVISIDRKGVILLPDIFTNSHGIYQTTKSKI